MSERPTKSPAGQSGAAGKSKKTQSDSSIPAKRLPPRRCLRLLVALASGSVTREQADRIAPASNAPHYVGVLRHKFDMKIPCERVPFVTKDGVPSWYGRYHATPADREKIRELLASMEAANDSR